MDKTHCGNWIAMCSGCVDLKCDVGRAQCDGCQLIDAERRIEQLESKLSACTEQLPVAWEIVPNALHEGGLFRAESAARYIAATSLHTTVRPLYAERNEAMTTPNENRDAAVESASTNEAGGIPTERYHTRSEIWWLIERESPAQFVSGLAESLQLTNDAWQALKFPTKEVAEEILRNSCYGKSSDWRILDHVFIPLYTERSR